MKKRLTALLAGLILLGMTGLAQASLTTIGTASYGSENYNLIYDDDDNGHGGGGLVWLDYTHSADNRANQVNWATGVGSSLTVTLNPGYTTSIDWTTGWRLPDTVDGPWVDGYEGDPDGDGEYSYTYGYNLANSEMGHLYYTELGNLGIMATDGSYPQPGWGLTNSGDFDNLSASWYWSGTEYASNPASAWGFTMYYGSQHGDTKYDHKYGLAVRSGHVSAVPIPAGLYLLGSGLICIVGLSGRKRKNRR